MKNIEKQCMWFKNPSITENNKMYDKCHGSCDGNDTECPYYVVSSNMTETERQERESYLNKIGRPDGQ